MVLVLLVLALFHRGCGIGHYPMRIHTTDELHYAWMGLSLLHGDKSTTWSGLNAYDGSDAVADEIVYAGAPYRVVSPALDHPPLYGVAVGVFAELVGAVGAPIPAGPTAKVYDVDVSELRLFSLLLFAAAFLLLYDLARRHLPFSAVFAGLVAYSALHHVALHQRLAVTESLSTPLFLLNLCLLDRFLRGELRERTFGVATIALTAAALLTKVVAVSQGAAIAVVLLLAGRKRASLYPIVGGAAGAGLYVLYGWWQGWEYFVAVLGGQKGRFSGFDTLERMIVSPRLASTFAVSYPLLAAWLALFQQALARPQAAVLFASPFAYLAGFAFFAVSENLYGWHLLFMYPFLAMALGAFASEALVHGLARPATYLVFVGMLLPYVFQIATAHLFPGEPGALRMLYPPAAAVALAGVFLLGSKWRIAVSRIVVGACLAAVVGKEAVAVWNLNRSESAHPAYIVAVRGENAGGGETADNLVDGDPGTKWTDFSDRSQIVFALKNDGRVAKGYAFRSADGDPSNDPGDWSVLGSRDGWTWTELDRRTGERFPQRRMERSFLFGTPAPWPYLVFNVESAPSGRTELADAWLLFEDEAAPESP